MIDLSRLNTEQKEAVSTTEGPVLAGAGTGTRARKNLDSDAPASPDTAQFYIKQMKEMLQ